MKSQHIPSQRGARFGAVLLFLGLLTGSFSASALDSAALISVSIQPNAQVMPRTMFTQTWTVQNNGTTTWTPGQTGCTLNPISKDSLGAIPLFTNDSSTRFIPSAIIGSGKSVGPGSNATFSMSFIAPEAAGTYTDTFQLNSASSVFFGPNLTVQIVVAKGSSTNQYDRSRVISYANNYSGFICSDGYYWTNSSGYSYTNVGTNLVPVPAVTGDDCAHFVSCCIGSEPHVRGGGLAIPSRTATYGEPGAGDIIYTVLIGGCYAVEVPSLSQLSPGDLVGWNWEGETNSGAAYIDHVTLYLGKGLLASHANSALDVSASTWYDGVPHYIHIYDSPTIAFSRVKTNLVVSWTTNWSGYSLYSATNLSATAVWTKVSKSPVKVGVSNFLTNAMSPGTVYYRLKL